MEMSDEHQAPAALPPGTDLLYLLNRLPAFK